MTAKSGPSPRIAQGRLPSACSPERSRINVTEDVVHGEGYQAIVNGSVSPAGRPG